VRTFADPSFFRLIHTLIGEANSDLRFKTFAHRGANWNRERHSFSGAGCGFAVDRYLISKPNPNGWRLLFVKEIWWDENDKTIRSTEWAKPLSGDRSKILEWLRLEERRILVRSTAPEAAE
jgi:hypothetical protein